jgi:hypothetical protein
MCTTMTRSQKSSFRGILGRPPTKHHYTRHQAQVTNKKVSNGKSEKREQKEHPETAKIFPQFPKYYHQEALPILIVNLFSHPPANAEL